MLKTLFILYFESSFGGPDKNFYQLGFLFLLKGIDVFCMVFV